MAVLWIRPQSSGKNCSKLVRCCIGASGGTAVCFNGKPQSLTSPAWWLSSRDLSTLSFQAVLPQIQDFFSFACRKNSSFSLSSCNLKVSHTMKFATEFLTFYCILTCKCLTQGFLILSSVLTHSVHSGYVVHVGAVGRKGLQMLSRKVPCLRRASTAMQGWQRCFSQELSSEWAEGVTGTARLWFICLWCNSFVTGE